MTGKRLEKLRQKLKEKDLDGILIVKRENYMYISGFTGTYAYLVISQEDAVLLTDFRYSKQAKEEAEIFEVIEYEGRLLNALNDVIVSKGIKRLGFEENVVTYKTYTEMKKLLKVEKLVPVDGMVEDIRAVKDDEEIEIIKKAVEIADHAFSHILNYIKPGVSEYEIALELEHYMKKKGAKGTSFETIVASGYRSFFPHGTASSKKIENNEAVTLDFGAVYKNYCSDMTRTVFVGKPDDKLFKIYDIVLKAQKSAIEAAKKGFTGKEIDSVARNIIEENGYGKNFGHGLGHGVGLEVHEKPTLSKRGDVKMENGMVVTIEPGIYLENLGGVRIEDIVVINDDFPVVLTKSPKEIIVL
ncbi:M24 family metallopeptidase [Acetivibrio saccincola]|uniref:Peptidase M24 family protein n=1 Tax=Acetivibrio saccincola TaxID=1677857 RepID=A0A2K9E807_9FIRM|nr:Xaa-Pro peptidase family protein [Acetivibrio saccincola]AUG57676.1 putative peptidase [Acetivibrio saccincola]PQQ67571.1 peptidase M24 family protein [Acetivibrio saccincola]HQD28457.1 Xaa-Pro peptidase family protein [Acetivibrio saccincola]